MPKIKSALSTAASYLTSQNIINATKCSGKVLNAAGKAVEYGGRSIKNLSQEGKKVVQSYVKYLNQKDPKAVKDNEACRQGMISLFSLIADSGEFAEKAGHDIADMGSNMAHFEDPINPQAKDKAIDTHKTSLIEVTA